MQKRAWTVILSVLATGVFSVNGERFEEQFWKQTERKPAYDGEKFSVAVTDNLCELGKITAIRFLLWVEENPRGVIALPTGKTPEYFIKYLSYFSREWNNPAVQKELKGYGLKSASFPDTSNLRFVQLDEFFPLDIAQENSFTSFVKKYYLSFLKIKPENALTMEGLIGPTLKKNGLSTVFPEGKADLNLLIRTPATTLEKMQRSALEEAKSFCDTYEQKIRDWGGIGFFLGGIGPDGHVAFNLKGSLHNSRTRLIELNYETAAASAGDLGGIESAKGKLAATIGLDTICCNPNATAIIFAAGEGKARPVATAVQEDPCMECPATALQKLKGARFYITKGAARQLKMRKHLEYASLAPDKIPTVFIDETLTEIALSKRKTLANLTAKDLSSTPSGEFLLAKFGKKWLEMKDRSLERLIAHLENGLQPRKDLTIFHTGPHHDDILLSYFPVAKADILSNKNIFCCLTSGFTSVTNEYLLNSLRDLSHRKEIQKLALNARYADLLDLFNLACSSGDANRKQELEAAIFAKKLCEQYKIGSQDEVKKKIKELTEYFSNRFPGQKDTQDIQTLKGLLRESEEDRVWTRSGADVSQVLHLRSKFYNGEFFTPQPSVEKDAQPLVELLEKTAPDLVTVALDPEGTGPSTHYKVLQIVSAALQKAEIPHRVLVWGYRNVWDRFTFGEGNLFIPVTESEMMEMHKTFLDCYATQRQASFPSPAYNGPFSAYAIEIQREQWSELETLLGKSFFQEHSDPRLKKASGLVIIKELSLDDFSKEAISLRNKIEAE
ncbi:MAG: glucosamine-6-phosphate deaminase [Verrucomicrobia bacterium]|nr:glucosamine-6-phosphate deaminase [Verrucomicrobiota bacterium]